jgi:hypothetical protein
MKTAAHTDRNLEQRFEMFVAKYEEELEQFQQEGQVTS